VLKMADGLAWKMLAMRLLWLKRYTCEYGESQTPLGKSFIMIRPIRIQFVDSNLSSGYHDILKYRVNGNTI